MSYKSAKPILIVTTSATKMGDSGKTTGAWLEEVVAPYYSFVEAGHDVTLASVKGGAVPIDERSIDDTVRSDPVVGRYFSDKQLQKLMKNTQPYDAYQVADFDAIFLPGGHGAVFDYPQTEGLLEMIAEFDRAGKVVSSVCHGPAALVNVIRADGQPLLKDRRVTGFSNNEEIAVGLADVVPFMLEDELVTKGGKYSKGEDFVAYAVADGNLVTGQNPQSSSLTAAMVIGALHDKRAAA